MAKDRKFFVAELLIGNIGFILPTVLAQIGYDYIDQTTPNGAYYACCRIVKISNMPPIEDIYFARLINGLKEKLLLFINMMHKLSLYMR